MAVIMGSFKPSHNRSDSYSGLGYLDGVTMRISERHNPPVPTLPARYWLPESLLSDQIDFALERKVLEVVEKRQKDLDEDEENFKERTRLRLEEEEKERLKREEEQKQDSENAEGEDKSEEEASTASQKDTNETTPDVATSSSTVLFPSTDASTLFPLVTAASSLSTSSGTASNLLAPIPVAKKATENTQALKPINIADFENDTYSPFDTVELKSINDIEVLASVLQNTAVNNANSAFRQPCDNAPVNRYNGPMNQYSGYSAGAVGYPASSQTSSTTTESQYGSYVTKPYYPYAYPGAGYATTTSYNTGMMYSSTVPSSYSTYTAPVYSGSHHSYGLNYSSTSGLQNIPHQTSTDEQASVTVSESSNSNRENFNFYTKYFSSSSKSGKSSDDSEESNEGTMKSSKSVPDLMQELEKELNKRKAAQTPPPRTTGEDLQDWQPWPELPVNHSPVRKPSIPAPMERRVSLTALLPDPYSKLSPKRQDLVRQITEMGFSRPRVARLCQQHKGDEKTIIESLLLIQSLEEAAGIQGDAAEKAYQFFKEDEKKAAEFLQLLKQFMDLGFEEKRVTDAFKKCGNDKNKILDALIA